MPTTTEFDANQLPPDDEFLQDVFRVFAEFVGTETIEEAVIPAVFDAVSRAIEGATRQEILDIVADISTLLVRQVEESSLRGIAQIIGEGLERRIGVDGVARRLREQIGLTPSQVKTLYKLEEELFDSDEFSAEEIEALLEQRRAEMIEERAETIAQTEMRNAVEAGEQQVAKKRGNTHKVSISRGDNKVSDICRRAEAQGPIPIDADFVSGRKHSPHHPKCRCTIAYIQDSGRGELERARKRSDERAEETARAKEEAKRANEAGEAVVEAV